MKMIKLICKELFLATLFTGCFDPSVYVAGWEDYGQGGRMPKLWKNGVAKNLTDGKKHDAVVLSVYVSGNDVYAMGYDAARFHTVAGLWKNGVAQHLTVGSNLTEAYSVYVSDSNVYVAGREQNKANLWKNGEAQSLTDGTFSACAHSVFVTGNDVFVAGWEQNEQKNHTAKLWKNGVAQNLTDGTYNAKAYSVYVSGGDMYVAGWEESGLEKRRCAQPYRNLQC